ncbi:MAG: AMP-dependent synthetase/ligase [Myxococcota bacterium]
MTAMTNLVQLFQRAVERFPEREYLGTRIAGPRYEWITYRAFARRVDDARAGLAQLGVKPGSMVGVISNNRLEWAVAHFAALGLGACWVPMYEAELVTTWEHIIRDSGVEVLFVSRPDVFERLRNAREAMPSLRHVVYFEGAGDDTLAALERRGHAQPVPVEQPTPEQLALLIYTSGTTGNAKGVELTHANLVSNHLGRVSMFPTFDERSRTLNILPWAHVYGLGELHTWTALGGSIGLVGGLDTLLGDFSLVRPTFMLAVPRVFNRVYNALWAKMNEAGGLKRALFVSSLEAKKRERELAGQRRRSLRNQLRVRLGDRLVFAKIRELFGGRLEGVMTGSAAMNPELSQFFFDVGVPLYDVYGMTETSPGIALNCPSAHRGGSVGKPMPGVRVVIDHSVVEPDANDGEIVVYGPNVMRGYHHRPDATAAVMTPDGGLRTGDRGRFDADGFLFITGRLKDQFKLENGKYVFPAALEEALELHPLVQTSMVYGDGRAFCVALVVPDAAAVTKWAEQHHAHGDFKALIARDDFQAQLTSELTASLKGRFGSYEIPKKFIFLDEPFTVANGLLTQTMKLKRLPVVAKYRAVIDAAYR